MPKTTYGRLDEVLRGLNFSFTGVQEKNRVYLHKQTGALIVYPEFPAAKKVLPRHLLAVRAVLDAYGIADPLDFAAKLQRAS
jgi:hypothetical protein